MPHKFLQQVSAAAREKITEIIKLSFGLLEVLSQGKLQKSIKLPEKETDRIYPNKMRLVSCLILKLHRCIFNF